MKANDANRAELSMLAEEFEGALLLYEPSGFWSAGGIKKAFDQGNIAEILPFVLRNPGARLVFEAARRQSHLGFSARARAANTQREGMRRMLGNIELQLIPSGETWHLVLRLPESKEAIPTTLIVSAPDSRDSQLEVLQLNQPIAGYIQQRLNVHKHATLFALMLEPESQLSLH